MLYLTGDWWLACVCVCVCVCVYTCESAGMYTGSGFIIAAVIQAENAVLSVIFFAVGEFFLVVYCFIYQKFTKFDDREAIEAKNVAAGLHWGLNLVALGLLLSRAIYLSNSIIVFGVSTSAL
jgi:hypothetical protein